MLQTKSGSKGSTRFQTFQSFRSNALQEFKVENCPVITRENRRDRVYRFRVCDSLESIFQRIKAKG